MNIDFRPFLVLWSVMAVSVLILLVWRKAVSRNEDDQLHLQHVEEATQQMAVAQRLELIDKWGKIVTGVTVAFGVIIAALFVYQTWILGSTTVAGA